MYEKDWFFTKKIDKEQAKDMVILSLILGLNKPPASICFCRGKVALKSCLWA